MVNGCVCTNRLNDVVTNPLGGSVVQTRIHRNMQSKDFSENLAICVNFQITAHGFTYLQEQKSQFNFLDIRNIMGVFLDLV